MMLRLALLLAPVFCVFGSCPGDYPTALGSLCVYSSSNSENFCKAMKRCKERSPPGELIRGEENLQLLIKHGSVLGSSGSYLIGLHDFAKESNTPSATRRFGFRWTDNTKRTVDTNWHSTEPNDYGGQDCVRVYMGSTRSLDDFSCGDRQLYVCQMLAPLPKNRAYAAIPTSEDTSSQDAQLNDCEEATKEPNEPFSVASLRACAKRCSDTPRSQPTDGCQTFYYHEQDKKCLLVQGRNVKLGENEFDGDPKWMRYG